MWSTARARPTSLLRRCSTQLRSRPLTTRPASTPSSTLTISRPRLALLALGLVGATAYTTSTLLLHPTVYADTDSAAIGHYSDASTSTSPLSDPQPVSSSPNPTSTPRYASPSEVQSAITQLRRILPSSQVSTGEDERLSHAQAGGTHHHPHTPDVVVYVESTEDVVKVVKVAGEWRVPVVPYSGESTRSGGDGRGRGSGKRDWTDCSPTFSFLSHRLPIPIIYHRHLHLHPRLPEPAFETTRE